MTDDTKESRSDTTNDSSNWIGAVVGLTKLTQTGHLKWRRVAPSEAFHTMRPEGEIASVYITEYKEFLLRLYEEIVNQSPFKHSPLRTLWERKSTRRIVLEMLDSNLETLTTFPQANALQGLLSAVKYQVSDVKNVLEGIVKEADLVAD